MKKLRIFKKERCALGFTQKEIGPLLGVSPRTIENWEQTGRSYPRASVWMAMDTLKTQQAERKKNKKK